MTAGRFGGMQSLQKAFLLCPVASALRSRPGIKVFFGAAGRRLGAVNQNPHQTVYPSIRITRLLQSPPDSGESLIEANVVRSPAFSPDIGSSRAVSGLRSPRADAHRFSRTPPIA